MRGRAGQAWIRGPVADGVDVGGTFRLGCGPGETVSRGWGADRGCSRAGAGGAVRGLRTSDRQPKPSGSVPACRHAPTLAGFGDAEDLARGSVGNTRTVRSSTAFPGRPIAGGCQSRWALDRSLALLGPAALSFLLLSEGLPAEGPALPCMSARRYAHWERPVILHAEGVWGGRGGTPPHAAEKAVEVPGRGGTRPGLSRRVWVRAEARSQ